MGTRSGGPHELLRPDRQRVEIRIAGWWHHIAALALTAIGILLAYRALRPADQRGFSLGLLVGGVTMAALGFRGLVRGGCRLDRASRTLTKWWGFRVPFHKRTASWDQLRSVRIKSSRIAGSFFVTRDCVVVVDGPWGPIEIKHVKGLETAREWAYALSNYMGITYLGEEGLGA